MKVQKYNVGYYKACRDEFLKNKNKYCAAYFQALIVQAVERSAFSLHKKGELEQHRRILNSLFGEIFGFYDENYFMGVYYELILAGSAEQLTGSEADCLRCNEFFGGSIREYVHETYCLHISCILMLAENNAETAEKYAENLLKILEVRYGIQSRYYAKMKLHIIGEYFRNFDRESFMHLFPDNYDYFKKYFEDSYEFFPVVLCQYTHELSKYNDGEYTLWMTRCEETAENNRKNNIYNLIKSIIAWSKAEALKKQNKNRQALELLQHAITEHVIRDENPHPFYRYVYLAAAYNCYRTEDYTNMILYAQSGIKICESCEAVGSELYYNLYMYVGIKHILDNDLAAAENLYSSSLQDITQKFGTENENYILYKNNLWMVKLSQGKLSDADDYIDMLINIKDAELKRKCTYLMSNALHWAITGGSSQRKIKVIYNKCAEILRDQEYKKDRERLDTIYLSYRVNKHLINDETLAFIKKLSYCYKDNFSDGLSIIYWSSVADYKWQTGKRYEALELYENIMDEINTEKYSNFKPTVIKYIQLLILENQYDRARSIILTMLDLIDNEILNIGVGDIFLPMTYMRHILSLYIFMADRSGIMEQSDNLEIRLLFEKIVHCKTIERELKSLLSQYKDADVKGDVWEYSIACRKLSALELRRCDRGEDSQYYDIKRTECILEKENKEAVLSQKIPYADLIRKFKADDIHIPENTICAEYFAFFNVCSDFPVMVSKGENNYRYLVFVLREDSGGVKISGTSVIAPDNTLHQEMEFLLDATETEEADRQKLQEIVQHFHDLFAVPVLKHAGGAETIYLGRDFLMQMMPMDLIFYNQKNEILNLAMVDSVCYIREDKIIDVGNADALIIGNPKYNLNEKYEQKLYELPGSEKECNLIAGIFGTKAYTGSAAGQSVLLENYQKKVLHISTHGIFNERSLSEFKDLLDNSYIVFAGYEDWKYNRKNKDYGNGIVSGEDFLFMNLSKTDLVVLSACVSSLGNMRGPEAMHGMRWAIEAAGAGNTVTTLWKVNDRESAALIILFYRNLKNMPVIRSLYEAKKSMRNMTVAELKKDGELWDIVEKSIKTDVSTDYRPFEDWRYWAAFECYCG